MTEEEIRELVAVGTRCRGGDEPRPRPGAVLLQLLPFFSSFGSLSFSLPNFVVLFLFPLPHFVLILIAGGGKGEEVGVTGVGFHGGEGDLKAYCTVFLLFCFNFFVMGLFKFVKKTKTVLLDFIETTV